MGSRRASWRGQATDADHVVLAELGYLGEANHLSPARSRSRPNPAQLNTEQRTIEHAARRDPDAGRARGTQLRDLSAIAPFLADLGARHARYGVSAEHYPLVGGALLETMAEVAGAAWQPEITTEWTRAYQTVAQI